jgi:hypothetical protein
MYHPGRRVGCPQGPELGPVAGLGGDDGARVKDVEYNRDEEHEEGVEDVDVNLVGHELAALAVDELDDAEDGTRHDEGADGVQDEDVAAPWHGETHALGGRFAQDAVVEEGRDGDEESKDGELDEQAAHDDVAARLLLVEGVGGRHETTACGSCMSIPHF